MKTHFRIAVILLLGIMGWQSAAANCADEYTGENHSLYLADIDHPCPNPHEYAEYNLFGEASGDFDLYVLDTWNDTWYKSSTATYNEYLKVPIHCGYPHKAYVWTYSGSGSWQVCSPQITFGEGFNRIADSDKAPDVTALETSTTTGRTETFESGIIGRWKLTFDWDCDGSSDEDEIFFDEDGTFGDDETYNEGEWTEEGETIRWEHDEEPNASYRGSIYGIYMSGTMSTSDGSSGCWTAKKIDEDI